MIFQRKIFMTFLSIYPKIPYVFHIQHIFINIQTNKIIHTQPFLIAITIKSYIILVIIEADLQYSIIKIYASTDYISTHWMAQLIFRGVTIIFTHPTNAIQYSAILLKAYLKKRKWKKMNGKIKRKRKANIFRHIKNNNNNITAENKCKQ